MDVPLHASHRMHGIVERVLWLAHIVLFAIETRFGVDTICIGPSSMQTMPHDYSLSNSPPKETDMMTCLGLRSASVGDASRNVTQQPSKRLSQFAPPHTLVVCGKKNSL
jgi:hypothetical protein